MSSQHKLNEFVPGYVVHSDFIPNRVIHDNDPNTTAVLQQYQLMKSKGQVLTQAPVGFNPQRYVSVRTFEDVRVNQPIPENQFRNR